MSALRSDEIIACAMAASAVIEQLQRPSGADVLAEYKANVHDDHPMRFYWVRNQVVNTLAQVRLNHDDRAIRLTLGIVFAWLLRSHLVHPPQWYRQSTDEQCS